MELNDARKKQLVIFSVENILRGLHEWKVVLTILQWWGLQQDE
jgi:hypothetical protein